MVDRIDSRPEVFGIAQKKITINSGFKLSTHVVHQIDFRPEKVLVGHRRPSKVVSIEVHKWWTGSTLGLLFFGGALYYPVYDSCLKSRPLPIVLRCTVPYTSFNPLRHKTILLFHACARGTRSCLKTLAFSPGRPE